MIPPFHLAVGPLLWYKTVQARLLESLIFLGFSGLDRQSRPVRQLASRKSNEYGLSNTRGVLYLPSYPSSGRGKAAHSGTMQDDDEAAAV